MSPLALTVSAASDPAPRPRCRVAAINPSRGSGAGLGMALRLAGSHPRLCVPIAPPFCRKNERGGGNGLSQGTIHNINLNNINLFTKIWSGGVGGIEQIG